MLLTDMLLDKIFNKKLEIKENMKSYLIFIIQAYESASDTGALSDVTTIELIDKTPENAIKRAQKLLKKKFYRVSNIIEKEY